MSGGDHTRAWILLLAWIVLAATGLTVLVLLRPEGPCLEERSPKGRHAVECEHSEHVLEENEDVIWCRCRPDDSRKRGGA